VVIKLLILLKRSFYCRDIARTWAIRGSTILHGSIILFPCTLLHTNIRYRIQACYHSVLSMDV